MTAHVSAPSILEASGVDARRAHDILGEALTNADDGELFLEYAQTEALMFDNGRLKQATYDTSQGFGLRAVKDDAVGYAHSSDVSLPALIRAADAVAAVRGGYSGNFAAAPAHTNVRLYGDENPLDAPGFESKVKLLAEIDAYVRDKDPRVRQVSVSLGATWQVVEILRPDGETYRDIRPLVRVSVSIVVGDGDRMETGSAGAGGRTAYDLYLDPGQWRSQVDEALRTALVNLDSIPAPAGEMTVVLGAGRDALPLLAFTLERLYLEYGGRGRLTLRDYDALGRIKGSIEAAAERAFRAADNDSSIPRDREARLALLRRGLIPWLAGIDPDTRSARRRVARISEIPPESLPEQRLDVGLVVDHKNQNAHV